VLGPTSRLAGMNLNYWAINIGFSVAAMLAGRPALRATAAAQS
jgi:hypothetical protein